LNWRAAIYSGVAAGFVATLAQFALWSVFTDALPAILYRDARFTAAIVMGRGVLPPPARCSMAKGMFPCGRPAIGAQFCSPALAWIVREAS
jgi:hypothetical protein